MCEAAPPHVWNPDGHGRVARRVFDLLAGLGFRQGASCPNLFYNKGKSVRCSVHGDDFTSVGPKSSLDWFEDAVAKSYEVSIGPRLGPAKTDRKEARVLNRIVRWCDDNSAAV